MSYSASKINKIFIYGYFGWYNAGDDAIGLAILKDLSKKYPNSKFIITANDNYFVMKNNLNYVNTISFNPISILKEIKNSDLFIIAGGTHFQDQDEFILRRLKINLFFVSIIIYSNLFKNQPILLGHGLGPFYSKLSLFLVNLILKYSKFIIVRDDDSFNFVKSFGLEFKCYKGFDMAAGLFKPDYCLAENDQKILGISLLPFHDIYSRNRNKDNVWINELSKSLRKLLEEDQDLIIKLFAFRTGNKHSDVQILNKFSKQLDYSSRIHIVEYKGRVYDFMNELCECYGFIGMRYHSLLFSYLLNKPLIAIEYMGKCRSLANDIMLPTESIVILDDIQSTEIYENLKKFVLDPNSYKATLPIKTAIKFTKNSYNQF